MPGAAAPRLFWKFAAVFFAIAFFQANIWFSVYSFTDIFLWEPGVTVLKSGAMLDVWGVLPVHPGATFLFASAFVSALGVPELEAMRFVMMLSSTILLTLISYLCYRLRPESAWWFWVLIPIGLSKTFLDMTPPSAIAALLFSLIVLLTAKVRVENGKNANTLALIGVCAGLLLATRIDTGVLVLMISLPYLWLLSGRKAVYTVFFAGAYFLALDPFFWIHPIKHALSILAQAYTNHQSPVGFMYTNRAMILPIMSVYLAVAFAFLRPQLSPLPRDFLLWLLAGSSFIFSLLMLSSYHPMRYFFPLMTVWEMLLPLFLLTLTAQIPASWRTTALSPEFLVFLWLFLDRFPPILFLILQNIIHLSRVLAIS